MKPLVCICFGCTGVQPYIDNERFRLNMSAEQLIKKRRLDAIAFLFADMLIRLFYKFFSNFVAADYDVETVGRLGNAYSLEVVVNGSYILFNFNTFNCIGA